MQDNLEFLQWTKRYWDQYFPGGDYDALTRRKASGAPPSAAAGTPRSSGASASTSASTSAGASARRPVAASNTAAPRATRPAPAGGAASAALQQENAALKETVQGLERERDFYFSKLRDIELLIQEAMTADPELEKQEDSLLKQIQSILYSTEVRATDPASRELRAGQLTLVVSRRRASRSRPRRRERSRRRRRSRRSRLLEKDVHCGDGTLFWGVRTVQRQHTRRSPLRRYGGGRGGRRKGQVLGMCMCNRVRGVAEGMPCLWDA